LDILGRFEIWCGVKMEGEQQKGKRARRTDLRVLSRLSNPTAVSGPVCAEKVARLINRAVWRGYKKKMLLASS